MSRFRTNYDYTMAGKTGAPTNATWVGNWIWIEDVDSLAFIVVVPGASNPSATFSLQVSNDADAGKKNDPLHGTALDAQLFQAPTTVALTAAQGTASNPAGAGVAINSRIQFERAGTSGVLPEMPRAKWARLVYTITSGGAATGLVITMSERGI